MFRKSVCLVCVCLMLGLVGSASADLLGHWTLDEGSGNTINDSSGNGHHGTIDAHFTWMKLWPSRMSQPCRQTSRKAFISEPEQTSNPTPSSPA